MVPLFGPSLSITQDTVGSACERDMSGYIFVTCCCTVFESSYGAPFTSPLSNITAFGLFTMCNENDGMLVNSILSVSLVTCDRSCGDLIRTA